MVYGKWKNILEYVDKGTLQKNTNLITSVGSHVIMKKIHYIVCFHEKTFFGEIYTYLIKLLRVFVVVALLLSFLRSFKLTFYSRDNKHTALK